MTGREDTKSLKRKPTRKEEARKKGENLRHTHTPTPISLSFPCHHLHHPPQTSFSIFSLSFFPPIFLPLLRFSPEWRVLRHRRVCIASLFQARVPRLLFPRSPHRLLLRPSCPSSRGFIHTIFDVAVSSYPLARHPSPLLFSLPFPSPPTVPFRFIPLRARPSLSLGARTDARGDVPFYFIRGYEFFHPRRTGVSLAPTAPSSRGESQDGTRGLAFVDEGRDVADGQSIFFFFYFFLPFFENFLFLLVIESIPLECRFSSERGDLSGKVNWYCVKIEERTSSSRSM